MQAPPPPPTPPAYPPNPKGQIQTQTPEPPKRKRSCCCSCAMILFALIFLLAAGFAGYTWYESRHQPTVIQDEYDSIPDYYPPEY